MYEPNINIVSKLRANEKVLLKKDNKKDNKNNNIVRLALINLFTKRLTTTELEYLHKNIPLLPEWLQPY